VRAGHAAASAAVQTLHPGPVHPGEHSAQSAVAFGGGVAHRPPFAISCCSIRRLIACGDDIELSCGLERWPDPAEPPAARESTNKSINDMSKMRTRQLLCQEAAQTPSN